MKKHHTPELDAMEASKSSQSEHLEDHPGDTNESMILKVALITGSSSGIGANIASDLAMGGYRVIVTGTNRERVQKTVDQIEQLALGLSGSAVAFVGDLSEIATADRLIKFVKAKFARLDVLINNVCSRGESTRNLFSDDADLLDSDIESTFHLNCGLPLYMVHRLLKEKLFPIKGVTKHRGIVVNISSVAAQVVVPLHLYSITKACMTELTKQLASVSDETNVLAVTISPGPILTNERPHHSEMKQFTLTNSVGSPQDISALVLFAIEHAHLFNGQDLTIDGGYTAKQIQPSVR